MIDILVFGAHPDDIEFACGGILAKMAAQKKSLVLVDLTLGDKGTNGTPELRRKESEAAANMLGAKRLFLDFKDCEVFDSYAGRLQLVRVIREYKPKLVLAPLWKGEQNHPDHIACGRMARFACRYARFANILPELPIHWVEGILHYPGPNLEPYDFIVDVSDHVETWKRLMGCHTSQMKTFDYVSWNLRLASKHGVFIGADYAQTLVKGTPVVVDDILTVAKGIREI